MPSLRGLVSTAEGGGGWRWAEETSRLERHPTREIGKEGPRAKPSRHPRGATRKPLDPPSAFGFQRVESHRTKPLPPAVLGVLFWDFIFSALSALEKALGQRHFFLYFGISFEEYVKRGPAARNGCRVLAAHTDGNVTPLDLIGTVLQNVSPTATLIVSAVEEKRCV